MKKAILSLVLITAIFACNREAASEASMLFDKQKWMVKDPETIYAYRADMLDNLVDTLIAVKKRRPLPKTEILEMLGEPTRVDTLHMFYEVSMKQMGVIPYNAVTLVIKLKEDETVDKVLIAE